MNYEELINNIPANLSKIEQARYLYIELGRYFCYDENYFTTQTEEEKRKIFNKNIEDITDDNVVCTSLSRIYETLLKKIGIDARTIEIPPKSNEEGRLGHGFTEITIDGKKYFAGLIHDLMNIKTGFRTTEFFTNNPNREYTGFTKLSPEELKLIDDKIGYTYNGLYMEEFCDMVKKEMKLLDDMESKEGKELREEFGLEGMSEKDVLGFKIDFIVKHIGYENLHCIEKNSYFITMIKNCLDAKQLLKYYNISSIACVDKNSNISIFHVLQNKQDGIKSIYMIPHKGIIERVSQENVRAMFTNGMQTLSKSKRQELTQILLGDEKNSNYKSVEELLKLKQEEYSEKLKRINPKAINNTLEILDARRKSRGESISSEILDEETQKVFQLMEQYGHDIKQIFIENKETLAHITGVSPEKMREGKIAKSKNRANNYETEYGDWVFAYSSPIDGSNPYIARKSEDGMIIIGNSTYIYGGNNLEIKTDKNGNNRVFLKEPNYVYRINPQNFSPVITLKKDKNGEPYFEFSEEWISDQEVDIHNPEQVEGVETIFDVTSLLQYYQVLCDIDKQGIASEIRSSHTREEAMKKLYMRIQNGSLRYINNEAGINVNPDFERENKRKNFYEKKIEKQPYIQQREKIVVKQDKLEINREYY